MRVKEQFEIETGHILDINEGKTCIEYTLWLENKVRHRKLSIRGTITDTIKYVKKGITKLEEEIEKLEKIEEEL